ncbi:MAG: MurR/RpiR family transcriptional regulator [Butyrivibrio sp.]|nr:MurR/RpiR family transcriptional regulator [Butyrivibrio sp.]
MTTKSSRSDIKLGFSSFLILMALCYDNPMDKSKYEYMENSTKKLIQKVLPELTAAEKTVAEYFLNTRVVTDFSSKKISKELYVSEATLSRFAQKCGYKGYREFIYSYEISLQMEQALYVSDEEQNIPTIAKKVEASYYSLLRESFENIDTGALMCVASMLNSSGRVKVLGLGSSGFAAREFQMRFMRVGLDVEAITDGQIIQMTASLSSPDTLMIGFSLSGRSKVITESLLLAKKQGAKTALFSAGKQKSLSGCYDVFVPLSSMKNMDTGMRISPQFPILIMIDILYSYYFANDVWLKTQKIRATLSAISDEREDEI